MRKPIIGIVAPRTVNEKRPFKNVTKFVNNYPKMIIDAGGIPIGLLFPGGKFDESVAKLCDGFLIQGGADIESTGINIIKYASENKKPVLGICLGMQTMAAYEWVINKIGSDVSYDDIDNYYSHEYENEILKYYPGHNKFDPFYFDSIELSKHDVILDDCSQLYKIFKKKIIDMPSIHNQIVKDEIIGNFFKVTGRSSDGIIEVIESTDPNLWIIGVQFHPELEYDNLKLFTNLINESANRGEFDNN